MRPTLALALLAAALLGACRDRPQPVTGPRHVVVVREARPPVPGATVSAPVPAMVVVPLSTIVAPVSVKPAPH